MKKILTRCLLVVLLFTVSELQAQNCKINGIVHSKMDSLPLPGAVVQILNSDSTIVKTVNTDSQGRFELIFRVAKTAPDFFLKATYMGNTPFYSFISGSTDKLDMGVIYVSENVELSNITVIADNITEMADRTIVIPNTIQRKSSTNSLDLIKNLNLAGVQINILTNTVSINGLAPIYLVNGRKQTLEQITALNPNDILRVEYANSASARYINENAGGTINIILRQKESGGSVYGDILASPLTGFINGTINVSYNYKKSEFNLLYNNNYRDYSKRIYNEEDTYINDKSTINQSIKGIESPFGYLNQDIDFSYTYMHSPKTMFSAIFSNGIGSQHDENRSNVQKSTNNLLSEDFFRQSNYKVEGYVPTLDLYFSHQFGKNQSIEADLIGSLLNTDYHRTLYDNDVLTILSKVNSKKRSLIGEAVYKQVFSSLLTWSFGTKQTYSYTNNKYISNNSETELTISDTYLYTQFVGKYKNLSYNVGGGLKIYNMNDTKDTKSYYKPMVTANAIYTFSKNFRANYLFQFTPTLPSLSQISDVTQLYDSIFAVKGNPNLKPYNSLMNRILLTFSKSNFRANLWVSYYYVKNPISSSVYWDNENNLFVSQVRNQEKLDKFYTQIDIAYENLFGHVSMYVTGGWQRFNSVGQDYNHTLNNFYWSVNLMGYYKNFSLSCVYVKPQKRLAGETITLAEKYSNIMLVYKYNRLALKLGILSLFDNNPGGASWTLYNAKKSSSEYIIKDNSNMLILGATYSFDFGNKYKKNRKNITNADGDSGILRAD